MRVTLDMIKQHARRCAQTYKNPFGMSYDDDEALNVAFGVWFTEGCSVLRAKPNQGDVARTRVPLPSMSIVALIDLKDLETLPRVHLTSGEEITSRYVFVFSFKAQTAEDTLITVLGMEMLPTEDCDNGDSTYCRYPDDERTLNAWLTAKVDELSAADNETLQRVRRIIHDVLNELLS